MKKVGQRSLFQEAQSTRKFDGRGRQSCTVMMWRGGNVPLIIISNIFTIFRFLFGCCLRRHLKLSLVTCSVSSQNTLTFVKKTVLCVVFQLETWLKLWLVPVSRGWYNYYQHKVHKADFNQRLKAFNCRTISEVKNVLFDPSSIVIISNTDYQNLQQRNKYNSLTFSSTTHFLLMFSCPFTTLRCTCRCN